MKLGDTAQPMIASSALRGVFLRPSLSNSFPHLTVRPWSLELEAVELCRLGSARLPRAFSPGSGSPWRGLHGCGPVHRGQITQHWPTPFWTSNWSSSRKRLAPHICPILTAV